MLQTHERGFGSGMLLIQRGFDLEASHDAKSSRPCRLRWMDRLDLTSLGDRTVDPLFDFPIWPAIATEADPLVPPTSQSDAETTLI